MKDIVDKILDHPFVTAIVVGSITGGIAKIIRAMNVGNK